MYFPGGYAIIDPRFWTLDVREGAKTCGRVIPLWFVQGSFPISHSRLSARVQSPGGACPAPTEVTAENGSHQRPAGTRSPQTGYHIRKAVVGRKRYDFFQAASRLFTAGEVSYPQSCGRAILLWFAQGGFPIAHCKVLLARFALKINKNMPIRADQTRLRNL